jgi:hypothetical protein
MGCSWALTELSDPYHIVFLSDSQAAIQALNTPQVHSGLVMDTITQLNKLGTKHKVDLRWIPGHEGVPGNERADELAREGSTVPPVGPEPLLPLPGNFIIKEIRTHLSNPTYTLRHTNRKVLVIRENTSPSRGPYGDFLLDTPGSWGTLF